MDAPAPGARVEGQRCGCTAGRVRLIFKFLPASLGHTHNLGPEEGLGPRPLGWAFFSASPPPSKVADLTSLQGSWAAKDLPGGRRAGNGHGMR
jgi:hypothetical protein